MIKKGILYKELSYQLVGIIWDVQNSLGRYSREKQYADALEIILKQENVSYQREVVVGKTGNRLDFLINNEIILELKAKQVITKDDYYQTQRYLHATDIKLALLINFRDKFLRPKRIIKIETKNRSKFV